MFAVLIMNDALLGKEKRKQLASEKGREGRIGGGGGEREREREREYVCG